MADNSREPDQRIGGATAEVRGAAEASTSAQTAVEALPGGARAGQTASSALRRDGQIGAEVVRRAGDTARQATEAAAASGQRAARSMQGGAKEMWQLMALPGATGRGLQGMQQVFAGLVEEAIRTNLRVTQELFRLANPSAVMDMQRRFALQYLDALAAGQATMLRAARGTAEEASRPLEQRSGQGR